MLTSRSQPLAEPVEIEIDDTGELWAVVRERDGLGDNLPSDFLIRMQQGGFYGWPYASIGNPLPGGPAGGRQALREGRGCHCVGTRC